MNYLEILRLAVPETILVITALGVLGADLSLREMEARFRFLIWRHDLGVGCTAAIVWMLISPEHANVLDGMLVVDPLTQLVKIGLLVLTIFTVLLSMNSDFTDARGRVFRADPAGDGRHDVSGQRGGHPDDFRLAGADQPVALHPDGVQQAEHQVRGSGAEVFPVRRHVGGIHCCSD